MENIDVMVLRKLLAWRSAGDPAVLVTVVRTWGSSPRPVGSVMALRRNGAVVGSVSGGCIEDDLIHRFCGPDGTGLHGHIEGPPQLIRYGVTAEEAHRFGLPCGGTMELLVEFNPDVEPLHQLVGSLDRGHLIRRRVELHDGLVTIHPTAVPAEL